MKVKTIRNNIKSKVEDWLSSIEDKTLANKLKSHIIVTGGCIASMLSKEKVNDYDIYIDDVNTAFEVAHYYCKMILKSSYASLNNKEFHIEQKGDRIQIYLKNIGIAVEKNSNQTLSQVLEAREVQEDETKPKYRPVFISSNAISLSHKVQIILRFVGAPAEIHKNFDFVHATNYWYQDELVFNTDALTAIMTKELRYIGSKYPIASIFRLRKFMRRGYTINAGQLFKIMFQISKLDLNNIEVLMDQLVGVDVGYFIILLDAINSKRLKEPEWVLDYGYLCTLIDKIFNETTEDDSENESEDTNES